MNTFEKAAWEAEKENYSEDGMSQENCIEFIRNSKTATVTFSQMRMVNKIKKLAEDNPNDVKIVAENKDGSIVAHIPVSYIHIANYSREMTEEQKAAAAERFREMHAARKAQEAQETQKVEDA